MSIFRKSWAFILGLFSLMVGMLPSAHADAVTGAAASAAQTFTTDGTTAMSAIGAAIIGVAVIAVLFKWVKGMFFS